MATDDDGLSTFLSVRARLFGVAYRILRSAAVAEDAVQGTRGYADNRRIGAPFVTPPHF